MPYNANIPQSTDQISRSQQQLLDNFQALEPFGNGYAQFPISTVPAGTATTMEIYNINNVLGKPSLHIKRETTSALPAVLKDYDITSCVAADAGWSRLPSGIIIQWGKQQFIIPPFVVGSHVISMLAGVFSIAPYSLSLTCDYPNGADQNFFVAVNSGAPKTDKLFSIYMGLRDSALPGPVNNITVYWTAIGI